MVDVIWFELQLLISSSHFQKNKKNKILFCTYCTSGWSDIHLTNLRHDLLETFLNLHQHPSHPPKIHHYRHLCTIPTGPKTLMLTMETFQMLPPSHTVQDCALPSSSMTYAVASTCPCLGCTGLCCGWVADERCLYSCLPMHNGVASTGPVLGACLHAVLKEHLRWTVHLAIPHVTESTRPHPQPTPQPHGLRDPNPPCGAKKDFRDD